MIKNRQFKRQVLTTFLILGILIFSGILSVIVPTNITMAADQQEIEQEHETQNQAQPRSEQRDASARGNGDVGIEGVSDVYAEQFIDHYPGTTVLINVSVKNFGNTRVTVPFDVVMHISDGSTKYPSYQYQEVRTLLNDQNQTYLEANESINMTWNWQPPRKMPHESQFNFSEGDIIFIARFVTLLEDDENSGNNEMWIDIKVNQPDFEIDLIPGWKFMVGPVWITEPQEDPYLVTVVKGQTNQFQLTFQLENFGEGTFINYSISAPIDWKAIPPARQFWQSKSNSSSPSQNLSITVFPSVNNQYLPTATILPIKLKAICESYPLAYAEITFRVKVTFMPYPMITVPEVPEGQEVYYITPGWAEVNFRVYNMGNGEDNFDSVARVGETDYERKLKTAEGWIAIVHSGATTRILKRGEYQVITVKVYVPAGVRAGSPCPIKLIATSIKDPDHGDGEKNKTFYVFSNLFKYVQFDESEGQLLSMYPKSETSTLFRIRNTGNKIDKTIRVNVSSIPEDWQVTLDSSDIPPGGLARNATADIEVMIKTPEHVVESTYNIKIATISDDIIRDELTIAVQILRVRRIGIRCLEYKKEGNVSEKVTYLVTVDNRGNAKDSVDLRYSFVTKGMENMDWRVVMSKNFTTLYPYESRDVIVSVFIPLEALADTDFTKQKSKDDPYDPYIIQLRGISQNDTTVVVEKELEVKVNPFYDFSFSTNKATKHITLHQIESGTFQFYIANKGNNIDTYSFTIQTEHTWISIPSERTMLPGFSFGFTVTIDPPAHLSVGSYIAIINSSSKGDPKLTQQLELTVQIIEFDLEVSEIRVADKPLSDAEIEVGETVLLRAKISNVGDLDFFNKTNNKIGKIEFRIGYSELGNDTITYLPSKNNNQNNSLWVSMPWHVRKAQNYEITVKLIDNEKDERGNDKDFPDSRIGNNKLTGNIEVEGGVEEGSVEKKSSDMFLILILIIIFIIIMLIGIWMTISIASKKGKKGYTETGEYKPYEGSSKTDFDKDDEEEEEPEGGVLAVHDEHPYGGKKKDKFLSDAMTIVSMKPIKKTKPIKKSKPLSTLFGEGKALGTGRPPIAGYLPPKPKDAGEKQDGEQSVNDSTKSTDGGEGPIQI